MYVQKAHYVYKGTKEGLRRVLEVFSPFQLEQVDTYGDDSLLQIGPWWVEAVGAGPVKEYIFSLDEFQDLDEVLEYSHLWINQKQLTHSDVVKGYLMIKPGVTIMWADIGATEHGGSEYQEWLYRFPTEEQLTSILAERN